MSSSAAAPSPLGPEARGRDNKPFPGLLPPRKKPFRRRRTETATPRANTDPDPSPETQAELGRYARRWVVAQATPRIEGPATAVARVEDLAQAAVSWVLTAPAEDTPAGQRVWVLAYDPLLGCEPHPAAEATAGLPPAGREALLRTAHVVWLEAPGREGGVARVRGLLCSPLTAALARLVDGASSARRPVPRSALFPWPEAALRQHPCPCLCGALCWVGGQAHWLLAEQRAAASRLWDCTKARFPWAALARPLPSPRVAFGEAQPAAAPPSHHTTAEWWRQSPQVQETMAVFCALGVCRRPSGEQVRAWARPEAAGRPESDAVLAWACWGKTALPPHQLAAEREALGVCWWMLAALAQTRPWPGRAWVGMDQSPPPSGTGAAAHKAMHRLTAAVRQDLVLPVVRAALAQQPDAQARAAAWAAQPVLAALGARLLADPRPCPAPGPLVGLPLHAVRETAFLAAHMAAPHADRGCLLLLGGATTPQGAAVAGAWLALDPEHPRLLEQLFPELLLSALDLPRRAPLLPRSRAPPGLLAADPLALVPRQLCRAMLRFLAAATGVAAEPLLADLEALGLAAVPGQSTDAAPQAHAEAKAGSLGTTDWPDRRALAALLADPAVRDAAPWFDPAGVDARRARAPASRLHRGSEARQGAGGPAGTEVLPPCASALVAAGRLPHAARTLFVPVLSREPLEWDEGELARRFPHLNKADSMADVRAAATKLSPPRCSTVMETSHPETLRSLCPLYAATDTRHPRARPPAERLAAALGGGGSLAPEATQALGRLWAYLALDDSPGEVGLVALHGPSPPAWLSAAWMLETAGLLDALPPPLTVWGHSRFLALFQRLFHPQHTSAAAWGEGLRLLWREEPLVATTAGPLGDDDGLLEARFRELGGGPERALALAHRWQDSPDALGRVLVDGLHFSDLQADVILSRGWGDGAAAQGRRRALVARLVCVLHLHQQQAARRPVVDEASCLTWAGPLGFARRLASAARRAGPGARPSDDADPPLE